MKKLYKYLTLVILLAACSEDYTFKFQDKVAFKDSEASIDEGEIYSVEVQLIGSQRSTPIQVTYDVSGTAVSGVDFFIGGGSTMTIPANSSVGTIDITPVDNTVIETEVKTIILTITGASEGVSAGHDSGVDAEGKAFDQEYGKTIVLSIADNDCPTQLEGTYNTLTTGCAGDGAGNCFPDPGANFTDLAHVVTVTRISGSEYQFSDVTGGLYLQIYQAANQPVIIRRNKCDNLLLQGQPDTVFGNDEFNGSGTTLGPDSFQLTWSNGWGDQGITVFTRQ